MTKLAKQIISTLPQNKISKAVGILAKSSLSKHFIQPFANHFKIDTSLAEKPVSQYKSLNDFFTRRLKEGARPINNELDSIVSPVDGVIAQMGQIKNGTLIQAKGIHYSLQQLIANGNHSVFEDGHFMTVYLSPSDYHRIHMPFTATITEYKYVPGRLFPVNDIGVNYVEGLFTKNERLTTFFNLNGSHAALVKVGAFIVGSIQITYEDSIHNQHRGQSMQSILKEEPTYQKGEELGWFEFGSTIILILDKNAGEFLTSLQPGDKLLMGQKIGLLS